MRGLRSTIALIAVLGGLGAYIYFVTWKKTPETAASKQEKVFTGVEADKVEELKVTSDKGDVTTLKKENGAWNIVAPLMSKADESEANAITSAIGQLEVVRVIDENPADLKDYGLTSPRIQIEFKGAGDKDYKRLVIGDKSPTGSDLFARRNEDKKVFLVPAAQETTFNKGTFELRDKVVLKLDRDKVDGVEIDAGGKKIVFAKDNAEWKITQPTQARADFSAVEGLIGRLQTTAMKSIAAENPTPADLKKYGLDKPSTVVDLKMGSARATFAIGGKAGDNTVYARDVSKPAVVTVESMLADDLKKGADDYRRKDIFEFRSYNATRLEVARGDQTVVFDKVKGEGKDAMDKWRRASPNAADVDKDKMESLLNRVSNMRATAFVDASTRNGLDKPVMTVAAKFDENKKEDRISFGKVGDDVFVSRPGEAGAAKIDPAEFNEVTKALDELSK
jgi:Domain of unknown function (DUF4340)